MRGKRKIRGDATVRAIRQMSFEQKMELLLRIKMERNPQAALRMLADASQSAIQWKRLAQRS